MRSPEVPQPEEVVVATVEGLDILGYVGLINAKSDYT